MEGTQEWGLNHQDNMPGVTQYDPECFVAETK